MLYKHDEGIKHTISHSLGGGFILRLVHDFNNLMLTLTDLLSLHNKNNNNKDFISMRLHQITMFVDFQRALK